jgi:hypothetical protein
MKGSQVSGTGWQGAGAACAVLPEAFGPGLLGDVLRVPNNYTAIVPYRTEREPLQALLPPGLTVAGQPVVSFRARRAEGIEWADGTSHFVGVTTQVEVERADGTRCAGMHFLIGWEDDAMVTIIGREVAGTVKLPADITFDRDVRRVDRWLVHHRGRPLLEVECRDAVGITGIDLEELRAARRSGCTIGYKGLPTVDGRALGEHYATEIPTVAEVNSAWHVDGRVTLFDTRPQTALWHDRAVRALRSLPLLERLPGTCTFGTYSLDLGRAHRLT